MIDREFRTPEQRSRVQGVMTVHHVPILALLLAACSCGGGAQSATPPPSETTSTTPGAETPPEERTAGPSAPYEVHEWGLVRGDVGDTQRYGAIAPPVDVSMLSVDKPVLYFHAPAAMTLASVTVEARSGGTLVETWPLTPLGARASWTDVAIDPAGECIPSQLPDRTQPPCAGLTGECETPSLALVRTSDAACVRVGGRTERFLFYRGRAATFTPPLRFERTGSAGVVRVTNEGDAVIPGMLVRFRSDGFRVRTLAAAPPAPHQTVEVGADYDAAAVDPTPPGSDDESPGDLRGDGDMPALPTSGPGRRVLVDAMHRIGLTDEECDAFMRAWEPALFGPGQPAIDTLTADGTPGPRESFVYFLPAASLESLAHLELDPPPSGGVHRAIAMWSMIAPSGATH